MVNENNDDVKSDVDEILNDVMENVVLSGNESDDDIDDDFEELYKTFHKMVKGKPLDGKILLSAAKSAMEIVEDLPIKGSEQKDLVMRLLRKMCETSKQPGATKCLELLDSGVVDKSIDLIVDATKGKFNINAATEIVKKGCLSCFS
tara:strand:- start:10 stop:450 length:441 start_codon:yes stop_codon:yes gene_type:complete